MTRSAPLEDIRRAYRALARAHHPDRHGGRTTPEMVRINEAWRILSDSDRRRRYDAAIDGVMTDEVVRGQAFSRPEPRSNVTGVPVAVPARFPWKFVLGFFVFATAVILVIGALAQPGDAPPIDNIIRVGSCVDVNVQIQEAWEVPCDGPHDAQVASLVPFDSRCPVGTTTYRDRQGLGLVCAAT